jgi:ATP-dependent protease ClpP protease subunit
LKIKPMRKILIAILITLAAQLGAETRSYGSFLYNPDHPNALFFLEDINASDSFELRKALRNHPIDTLVLASPGGNVWEGLSMAGIIFDKKLNVFVPKSAVCASACSFMFFGGNERLAEGRLGVHQFASSDGNKVQAKETTQATSQFTVSEIIGFLNEFNTPRFVLERMFQDRAMYWFSDAEKIGLNSEVFSVKPAVRKKLSTYVIKEMKKRKLKEKENPSLTTKEIVQLIQKRLNEIGCNAGYADGIWGKKQKRQQLDLQEEQGCQHQSMS